MKLSFGVVEVVSKAINWGALPLVALLVGPEKYGSAVLIFAFITIYSSLIMFGQGRSILKHYDNADSWVVGPVAIIISIAAVVMLLSAIALGVDQPWLIILVSTLVAIHTLIGLKLRVLQDTKRYLQLRLSYVVVRFLLALWSLYAFESLVYYLVAEFLAVAISLLALNKLVMETGKEIIVTSATNIMPIASMGLPLFLQALSGLIVSNVDKVVLARYLGSAELGQYAYLFAVASSFAFVNAYYAIKFEVLIYRSSGASDAIMHADNFLKGCFSGALMAAPVLMGFYYVSTIFNNQIRFQPMLFIVVFLGQLFLAVSLRGSYLLTYKEKNGIILLVGVIAALVNVVGNFLIVPRYGLAGAAIISLLSFFVLAVLMNGFAKVAAENA